MLTQCDDWPCRDCRGCSRPILVWGLSDLLQDKSICVVEPISLLAVLRSCISGSTQRDKPEFRVRCKQPQRECDGLPPVMAWQPTKRPEQRNNKDHGDHGQGDGNRHDDLLAHNLASQYCGRFSNSGSLAMLMAMRRASSRVIRFAADRRPGSFS